MRSDGQHEDISANHSEKQPAYKLGVPHGNSSIHHLKVTKSPNYLPADELD